MAGNALVSIITPAYNSAVTILQAIDSVKRQSYRQWEHIIVDDCSSDSTKKLIFDAVVGDDRFVLLSLNENMGPAYARNLAISVARGKYLAFLDSDDYWLPEKLRKQLDFMIDNKLEVSHHAYRHISYDGCKKSAIVSAPSVLDWSLYHRVRGVGYCLTFMVKNTGDLHLVFPEGYSIVEDFLAFSNVLRNRKSYLLDCDLARYRVSPNSRSKNKAAAVMQIWKVYRRVEGIPFMRSLYYFVSYICSSLCVAYKSRL